MKCPVCKDVTLLMSEKKGVEIDYCPECRGIWLDRGELDKLIAAEEQAYASSRNEDTVETKSTRPGDDDATKYNKRDDCDKYGKSNKPYRRKRESFLGEIFEMFGDD